MEYVITSVDEEPICRIFSPTHPTIETMGQMVARAWNYESVEALAHAMPDLWLGWHILH